MQESQPVPKFGEYDPAAAAHTIVNVASDKKAADVVLLDIRKLTTLADYFVIMSGTSRVQIRALADNIEEELDKERTAPLHIEGDADGGWVLLDYGAVVVHIFSPQQRDFYGLEELWSGGTTVVRIQ